MPHCWLVVSCEGKREIWRLGRKFELRIQERKEKRKKKGGGGAVCWCGCFTGRLRLSASSHPIYAGGWMCSLTVRFTVREEIEQEASRVTPLAIVKKALSNFLVLTSRTDTCVFAVPHHLLKMIKMLLRYVYLCFPSAFREIFHFEVLQKCHLKFLHITFLCV